MHSIDPELLQALMDRLGQLEAGLRQELASQVDRAERAEAALSAAQAQAATAAIAAQTKEQTTRGGEVALEAAPGADRILAFAREEAVRILAEARRAADEVRARAGGDDGFREVLVDLRCQLVERDGLVGELVSVTRRAINEVRRQREPSGAAAEPMISEQSDDDGGDDQR